ncbi:hypothetical protein [Prosthecobacter sp.]|uniref:hypothetical protein n=1 Tax=Prosthecobacter sp. TaxID=1965333 RepID=UPI003782E382
MKPHLCLLLLAASASASLLTAQDKPKDPFVKDKQTAAAPAVSEDTPRNIQCLLETFTLPQADYAALLDAPGGRDKLYSQVLEAVKAGSARLDGCHWVTNKSGMRTVLESVDELIHPSEWTPADLKGFQYPTALEMRQLGDRFEYETVLNSENGTLDVTYDFSRDQLLGLRVVKADTTLMGVPVANFFTRKRTSSSRFIPGSPTLLATLSHPEPGSTTLLFATAHVVPLPAPKAPAAVTEGNVLLTARVISLDRAKGWELLKQHGTANAALLADLKPLLASKSAALEHIATINVKPAVRAVHESGVLYTYGTQFSPPIEAVPAQPAKDPKDQGQPAMPASLAGTTAFENRSLGFRLEVEAVIGADGATADLTLAPEFVTMTGNLKGENWNEHYPDIPVFSCQKVTTSYSQLVGTTHLISTLNPPGDTGALGHKDTGRMWLLFLDVNLE